MSLGTDETDAFERLRTPKPERSPVKIVLAVGFLVSVLIVASKSGRDLGF